MLQLGDVPGEPTRQTPLDSSCIGHCTSERRSVPPPHGFVVFGFVFFLVNAFSPFWLSTALGEQFVPTG